MAILNQVIEILRGENVAFLSGLYGSNINELKKQKNDFQRLIIEFVDAFGHSKGEFFSSPGRTEISGNHTDHNHGRVLAGAVNLDNIALAAPNGKEIIQIKSLGYPDLLVDLSNLEVDKAEYFTSASLVRGICARMKELGYKVNGFDACIVGRVPKGSGLSSSASFEVLIGVILSELFNKGKLDPIENAIIGQYAENNFFGKPCGLMDQTACSVGGLVAIDFENPANPGVKKLDFNFTTTDYALVITNTGGNHADLNDEYAALPIEMKGIAKFLDREVQRQLTLSELTEAVPRMRGKVSDRAILRAFHFQQENQRVLEQISALEQGQFEVFLSKVIESGNSSFMYNQNIYPTHNVSEQGVSIGLAFSDMVLKGRGAWRVHGGGFAGTIQAFVPLDLLEEYANVMEHIFGIGACYKLFIRSQGAIRIDV